MKLTACLIVKNEAGMLARTLPELKQGVDEIILVDTGSGDRTIEVAKEHGAKVFTFSWINDFSAARNESLKQATGDWIIWIDADEYLPLEELKKLRSALERSTEEAHFVSLHECPLGTTEKKGAYYRPKVFRNNLDYHFIRPINEQLVDGNGRLAKGSTLPVSIYHWGKNLAAERMEWKRRRYVEQYTAALAADPNDPYFHFLLANNLAELKEYEPALQHYRLAFELGKSGEISKQALEKVSELLLKLKKLELAAEAADRLLKLDPENAVAKNVFATIFLVTGKIDLAIELLTNSALQSQAMPNYLLGKAYALKGERNKSAHYLNEAKKIAPEMFGRN